MFFTKWNSTPTHTHSSRSKIHIPNMKKQKHYSNTMFSINWTRGWFQSSNSSNLCFHIESIDWKPRVGLSCLGFGLFCVHSPSCLFSNNRPLMMWKKLQKVTTLYQPGASLLRDNNSSSPKNTGWNIEQQRAKLSLRRKSKAKQSGLQSICSTCILNLTKQYDNKTCRA